MTVARDLDTLQFGAVLKTALDAVVVMRLDGTIAGWNDVAERSFGWAFAEVEDKRMSEIIIPERFREAHENGLAHYLATGEAPVLDKHLELSAMHRDGHEIPVELAITRTIEFGEPVFLGFLRDISERHEHQRQQRLLIDELNHRVKNLLGVVGAIAHQTARSSTSLEQFSPAFLGRLESLGRAHEILTEATYEHGSLTLLAEAVLESFIGRDGRAAISGPDLTLAPRQFLSVSMILHELTTNSVKYGALSHLDGRVELSWTVDGDDVRLSWIETNPVRVEQPSRTGFGTKMIDLNVRHDLQGQSESRWGPEGLKFTLTFTRA
ncbi:MAG: HWE histidine kinase domain-containing protein [Pseudomonadota bacterium]|nr:HWE histidine kinase domain-containing protein [Pseudomonadota bacterium]